VRHHAPAVWPNADGVCFVCFLKTSLKADVDANPVHRQCQHTPRSGVARRNPQ